MKILMLVPFLPNTYTSGGQTRWYNLIKFLSREHEITLFSLLKDESERRFVPELEKYCKKVRVFSRPKSPWTLRNFLLTAFSFYPLLVIRNWSFKERLEIKEELKKEKYDLIHAEAFYVMPHLPPTFIPNILVEQTIEYQVYKHYVDTEVPFFLKPIYMIDIVKLRYWERYFWKKTTRLVAVSEDDKRVMQKEIPGIKVEVIPNGVDSDYYSERKVAKKVPPRILYLGNFKWIQNLEALNLLIDEVWPKVKKAFPKAFLWIVGRDIPTRVSKISKEKESNIEVTEAISDPRDAYQGSSVMVLPMKGSGGTRLKVIEAMASGLPIVSTENGVGGLGLTPGRHALVSDSLDRIADYTVDLLKSPKRAEKIGKEGQEFVRRLYDWKTIVKLHDRIYKEIVHE